MNMAARRGRKGQFKKNNRRRTNKYKGAVNLPNAAISLVTANAFTKSMFGVDVKTFLLDGWDDKARRNYDAWNNSWEITLGEIVTKTNQGRSQEYPMSAVIKKNLTANGIQSIGMIVGVKFLTNAMKKMGVARSANKLVRAAGAGKMVKF